MPIDPSQSAHIKEAAFAFNPSTVTGTLKLWLAKCMISDPPIAGEKLREIIGSGSFVVSPVDAMSTTNLIFLGGVPTFTDTVNLDSIAYFPSRIVGRICACVEQNANSTNNHWGPMVKRYGSIMRRVIKFVISASMKKRGL